MDSVHLFFTVYNGATNLFSNKIAKETFDKAPEGFRDEKSYKYYLAVSDMKKSILKQSAKSNLWLYFDGVNIDPVKVNKEIISSAKELIFTLPLL